MNFQLFPNELPDPAATRAFFLAIVVGISYVLYFLAQVKMVWDGFKTKSYGMPMCGIVSLLGVCFICIIGPYTDHKELFFPAERRGIWWVWVVSFALQLVVYIQYLLYGPRQPERMKELSRYFYQIAIGGPILAATLSWCFVVYYQDFYVNEIYPICTFVMATAYLGSLKMRPVLRGLSTSVAWLWAFATAFLYIGTLMGDMPKTYPDHADTGYGFIVLIYWLTIIVLFIYAYMLQMRKDELVEGFNPHLKVKELEDDLHEMRRLLQQHHAKPGADA